ncbi:Y-family DNA polymerase [Kushneria indalinina]|uniref:DNA polymerase V n=1 Tax=Kushneria indalinina DSM 14324 TaxID=1122140 RepID=A0A3D9DWU9_9GAMM|nr:Y-family DNA polymerase [Kushneria indalinina]REC94859.1 DNA polymerase V [Kushneria indalinina DSM 14324]
MIALVDCNNFYASCERVFRPKLHGVPVAVLSNNDGCVIARSQEVKDLGIAMGTPMHHLPREAFERGLVLCSSNYELYGDMSARVMATLREFTPRVEPYSIDESWLDFAGFDRTALPAHCQEMHRIVYKWTGIPVSVGVAPTRTLAKLANRHAKRHGATRGVFVIEDAGSPDTLALLERTPVGEVWGIGGRVTPRLYEMGIRTALDLARANPTWIRRRFSVVVERTARELAGTRCIDMNDEHDSKKLIMTSRSFGQMTAERRDVEEAVRAHASRGAEKLRRQQSLACSLRVTLKTNKHMPHLPQDHDSITVALPCPTDDTFEIVRTAQEGLRRLWKDRGIRYQKCGVQLMDLIDVTGQQLDVFQPPQPAADRERTDRLMSVLDQLNGQYGRGTVTVGVQRQAAAWQLRSNHRSNRWSTRWEELPTVRLQ